MIQEQEDSGEDSERGSGPADVVRKEKLPVVLSEHPLPQGRMAASKGLGDFHDWALFL